MKELRRGYEFDRTVMFVDDRGEPANVEGPHWQSSDTAVITLVETADPLMITIQAVGAVGAQAVVTVMADADLGEGIVPVEASDDIHVTSGQATSGSFTDSEPRPIETP